MFIGRILAVLFLAPAAHAPVVKEHIIEQKNRSFSVTELTIKLGESVVFHNVDEVTHNVFSMSPGIKFDIKTQKPGSTSTVPFEKAGIGEVRCAIHPNMKLKLTVGG
jgi:plastocyanin